MWKEDQSPRVKKERKPTLRGKWESVFSGRHIDNVPKETHAVSVMTQKASGNTGDGQRRKGRSSSPASHKKAKQTDGEGQKSSTGSGNKEEGSFDKSEIPYRFKFCKNPSCKFWHPPVCQNHKPEKGYVYGNKWNSDMLRQKESPIKGQRKAVQTDQLRY